MQQNQNPNQTKNLVIFLVLSFLLLVGYSYWNMTFKAPPPRPPNTNPTPLAAKDWPFANRPTTEQVAIIARVLAAAMPAGAGLDDAIRPAAELVAIANPPPPITPWPTGEPRREVRQATVAQLAALAPVPDIAQAARLAIELELLQTRPPVPRVAETPETKVELGDDATYFLKLRLTSKGAAVREIVLNRFQMADDYGLPVWLNKEKTQPRPLDLVPAYRIKERSELVHPDTEPIEFDHTNPFQHFVLYHYAKPDDDRPVDMLGKLNWTVVPGGVQTKDDRQEVSFVAEIPGEVKITKTFSLAKGEYHVGLSVSLESLRPAGSEAGKFRYQLAGARGLPIEGEWYTYLFRNAVIGWQHTDGAPGRSLEDSRTIATKMGGEEVRRSEKVKAIQYAGVAVQFFASAIVVDNQQEKKDFLEWARPTLEAAVMKGRVKSFDIDSLVLATSDKDYTFRLTSALVDAILHGEISPAAAPARGKTIAVLWTRDGDQLVATDLLADDVAIPPILDDVTVRVMTEAVTLTPGSTVTHKYLLYNGPVKVRLLGYLKGADAVNPELVERYENTLQLKTLTDYGTFSESGIMWWWTSLIIFFTNLMHGLLALLYNVTFEWSAGLCIIILTVMVRGAMFPIGRRQARISKDMQEKMAKLQPEMKKIKEKYKDDPWKLYQEQQELFKKHNVNQFAMLGGCLPLLAQLPIFMGLYYCLQESILFRLKPCLYIRNLAAPDMLIWWGEHIPVLGFISSWSSQGGMLFLGPYFNLLPVIAVVLMMVQQQVMQPPAMDEQQEMNMKMMKWMSILFGFMFYKVAAGLCLYFIASSLWGLAERKLQFKKKQPEPEASPSEPMITAPQPRAEPKKSRSESKKAAAGTGIFQRFKNWWDEVLQQASKQQQARRDDGDGRKKKRRDDETSRRNRED